MTTGPRLTLWLGLAMGAAVDHADALDPDAVHAEHCARYHEKRSDDLARKHPEVVDGAPRARKAELPLEPFLADRR